MFAAEQYRAKAAEFTPEVLLALCLRDRFANVGFQAPPAAWSKSSRENPSSFASSTHSATVVSSSSGMRPSALMYLTVHLARNSRICHPALSCSFRCTVRRALKTRTGAVGDNSAWAVPLSRPPNCNLPLCGGGTIDEALACQERKCFVSSGEGVSYPCIFFSRI